MWIVFAFCSALFAGMTAVLSKIGVKNINSNLATAIRTIVVLVFSWIMVFVAGSQESLSNLDSNSLIFLVLSGIATGCSWLCYLKALQIGDINKVTPIDKSSTVLTIILAFIFFNEKFTILKAGCLVLIGIGTYLMIEKKQTDNTENHKSNWLIWAVLSALFASITSILGKVGISGIDSTLGTAIRTLVVLFMAWVVVFVTKNIKGIKTIDKKNYLFLFLSGIATGGSWLCYYKALQLGPASVVVPIDKLSILITIAFSYIVFKEKLNKKSLFGLIFIVAGTLLMLI